MSSEPKFRPINSLLGSRPSYGPIPADLLLPWGAISFSLFILCYSVLHLPVQWTIALIVWGCASWWIFAGNNGYRNLSKFIPTPKRWSRGYVRYQPLQIIDTKTDKRLRTLNAKAVRID